MIQYIIVVPKQGLVKRNFQKIGENLVTEGAECRRRKMGKRPGHCPIDGTGPERLLYFGKA